MHRNESSAIRLIVSRFQSNALTDCDDLFVALMFFILGRAMHVRIDYRFVYLSFFKPLKINNDRRTKFDLLFHDFGQLSKLRAHSIS